MESKEAHLRLLTLNVQGHPFTRHTRSRLATIGQQASEAGLDVVCLQEIQFAPYIRVVRESFPAFAHYAYEPFVHAPKGGLMILSRLPIRQQRFVLYNKRGRLASPALADWILHKGILLAELVAGELPIAIVNTHLVANYAADWSRENRYVKHQQSELEQLRQLIEAIEPDRLTLVAGDFNVPATAAYYQEFLGRAGLHELLAEGGAPTYRPPRFLPGRYAQTLDHILLREPPGARLEASATIVFQERVRLASGRRVHLSDHSGILADVRVVSGGELGEGQEQ